VRPAALQLPQRARPPCTARLPRGLPRAWLASWARPARLPRASAQRAPPPHRPRFLGCPGAGEGKLFSPGNLRATFDNPAYERLISYYLGEKYTLRYTGGMVPDVFQILVKEKGVFTNVTSPSTKAKLRILFEVAPLALLVGGAAPGPRAPLCRRRRRWLQARLRARARRCSCSARPDRPARAPRARQVENAGGASSCDGKCVSGLDVLIEKHDQRTQICYGSVGEVRRFEEYLYGSSPRFSEVTA
jgi:sedoheptulose-bisphosphatase